MTAWTLAILVGGRSERMGQDKASLAFRGEPLLPSLVARVDAAEVLLVARPGQDVAAPGARVVEDHRPGHAAMGGVHAALCEARHPLVVIPCDLPLVNGALLRWLAMGLAQADLVLPTHEVPQPLHAAYGPACLPALEAALDAGRLSLRRGWFDALRVTRPTVDDWGDLDDGSSFAGANTPAEWAALEAR